MTKRFARVIACCAAVAVPLGTSASVAVASSISVTASVPSTVTLQGTIHDFEHTANVCSTGTINHDFETYAGDAPTTGLLAPTLDGNNLPVLASTGAGTTYGQQITSNDSFNQWWRDTSGVNLSVDAPLTINRAADTSSPSGYRYTYSNLSFFPADGKGWDTLAQCGDTTPQEDAGVDNNQHNFSFTDHLQGRFGYLPGETIKVGGDDDVWVFINGRLAIDLGGLHPIATSSVYDLAANAAALGGLVKGKTYSLDIFFAERHTQASTFTLDTTIGLDPTFGISNLGISASAPQPLGPGATDVAVGDIPSSALPATAIDAIAAAPLRSVPLRSVPLRSVPLRSVPLRSVPLRSVPLQSVLLSQVPLTGTTWQAVLAGTAFATAPLESVTLQQAFDAISASGYNGPGLTLDQIDLTQTPLRSMSLASVFLGASRLGDLPIGPPPGSTTSTTNFGDWCGWLSSLGYSCTALNLDATSPVLSADLQGVPLRSVPLRSVPLRSVPADAPLRSVPLRSVDIADSPLRSVPLVDLLTTGSGDSKFAQLSVAGLSADATVFDRPLASTDNPNIVACAAPTAPCDTLGHARSSLVAGLTVGYLAQHLADAGPQPITLGELGQLPADITVGDLADSISDAYPLTLGDVLLALMPPSAVPWESIPLGSLPLVEHQANSPAVTYTVSVALSGSAHVADGVLVVTLPPSMHYDGHVTGLGANDTAHSDGNGHVTFALSARSVPSVVSITFHANPGLVLGGVGPASVDADFQAFDLPHQTASATENDGGFTVTDAGEPTNNSVDTATPIAPDHLVLGAISSPGDVDYYRLPAPPAGTHVHVLLSHLPTDDDLVVYGPTDGVASPNAAPLRSVPLRSVPLLDSGIDATGSSTPTPQLLNDVPLLNTRPVMGESAHHGTDDEEVDLQSTGGAGSYTIQITGYNAATSNQPYLVRVVEDTPQTTSCPTLGLSAQSTLAGGLPAGDGTKKSLLLVNTQQLAAEFPGSAADLMTALNTFAARGDVAGLVVPVDADPATVAAYNTWNADPCSAPAANAVVEAINAVVRAYRNGSAPNISSVTLIGSDRQLPMFRAPDLTLSANENGYADSDSPVTGGDDPLSAAQRNSDMLTDDAYGSLNPVSWLGRRLYLPDLAVGRLVETPNEIKAQLQQFTDAGGALTPSSGLTTGYDFLADGAHAVDNALATDVSGSHATLIDDPGATSPWTRSQLTAALFPTGQSPYLNSINAHFDHNRALPSSGNATSTETDLFTVNDVTSHTGKLVGRLLFSMGCHAGLNVPNGYVGGATTSTGGTPARAQDWAQTLSNEKAIWVANTGFGLGDTAAVALSEELMRQFAQRLNGSMTAGQALQYAKQAYFGSLGAYGVYDEKAMEETVFYGLPMWRVGGAPYIQGTSTSVPGPVNPPTAQADPAAAHATSTAVTDTGFSGKPATDVAISPTFTQTTTGKGSVWSVGGETQVTHYRPIEPRTSVGVSPPAGKAAHGALITDLTSEDHLHVDAAFARPTVDLSSNEPEATSPHTAFPTQFQTLTSFTTPTGPSTRLVLLPGQFFSDRNSTNGTQRLFTSMHARVVFSDAASFEPPTINSATTSMSGSTVTFSIDATPHGGASIARVLVLYHTADSPQWSSLNLTLTGGVYTGTATISADAVEWFGQVEDSYGNVAVTDDKGELFGTQTAFRASVAGQAGTNGWFTGPVTVDAVGPASGYAVFLGGSRAGDVAYTITNDGNYDVTVKGDDAISHNIGHVKIDQTPPTAQFATPSPLVFKLGGSGAYTISCADGSNGSGVVDCPGGGTIDTSVAGGGVLSFTIHDGAGNAGNISLPYSVQTTFVGFLQPVDDPSSPTNYSVFKYSSTIPMKFQLKNNAGGLISDALAQTIVAQCGAKLSFAKTGVNSQPVDESSYTGATDSGGCFRYDATADQFIYNLGTKTLPGGGAGQLWSLRALVTLNNGVIADHAVLVGLK